MFESAVSHETPQGTIERRAERDVGGLVEQLDADRVEGSWRAVGKEGEDHFHAALERDLSEGSMGEAIRLAALWARATGWIVGRADQMQVAGGAAPVDPRAPDEFVRRRLRHEEV
jgi:hypothetical protein